jgi:3-oxoacyl-[acyl-carrier protein] reductase
MDFGISGKTALVLGASSGLGRAMAVGLAREGVNVAVGARRQADLAETARLCRAAGAKALELTWDLADRSVIAPNVARIEAELGPVDILINNTGGPPPASAAGQDPALWLAQFEVMVLSLIAITDQILPGMRARGWGRIITSTSSSVPMPVPNLAISNSLRAALHGWAKTLSGEVARDGITVNVIMPGRIATDRIAFLDSKKAEREGRSVGDVVAETLAAIPAGRLGDPEEFAAVATFLASRQAAYVTGTTVRVDGGLIPTVAQ